MTLRAKFEQSIISYRNKNHDQFDVVGWFTQFIYENKNTILNYPQVQLPADEFPDMDEEDLLEDLDLENCEVLSLKENSVTFCAGGDWQEPMKVEMVYDEATDHFTCQVLSEKFYTQGMSNAGFLNALSAFAIVSEQTRPTIEIRTADCVEYITKYYKSKKIVSSSPLLVSKNWKRSSKRGTTEIYRTFRNTVLGVEVTVISNAYEILQIIEQ
jgi:hypothetical protein